MGSLDWLIRSGKVGARKAGAGGGGGGGLQSLDARRVRRMMVLPGYRILFATMGSHQGLVAYQRARVLAATCRAIARGFPPEEAALADQLRRAADSAVLNIAVGNARGSNKDFRRFLETARASLKEVEVILDLALDGGLVTKQVYEQAQHECDEAARPTFGLLRSVNERISAGEVERSRRPGTRRREDDGPGKSAA